MNAQQAWGSVLAQLETDMPRASYNKWLRDTQGISIEGDVLTVTAPATEARDWLESRLTSTAQRLLIGILNCPVRVRFVAADAPSLEQEPGDEDQAVALEPIQWLDYESIVLPERQVVVKGYLRRLGREIGAKAIWLYIGFHQAAWMAHDAEGPAGSILHSREIMRFSGLSFGAFWRSLRQPIIQKHLRGLVQRVDPPDVRRYRRGRDGRPHRVPIRYRVFMTPRLSRADASALYARLKELLEHGLTLEPALRECLFAEDALDLLDVSGDVDPDIQFDTVMEMAQALSGTALSPESDRLAQELHRRIINALGDIHITHYFITRVIREFSLTPAQAWLVTVARDMAYLNWRTGERREVVKFQGGFREMAELVCLQRPKTVQAWFHRDWGVGPCGGDLRQFMQEIDVLRTSGYGDLRAASMPRTFRVRLDEPLDANGSNRADADGTNRVVANGSNMLDANGTVKNSLKHPLNTHTENTSSTELQRTEAVPAAWELKCLLEKNHIHPKVQRELLDAQVPTQAFVSWVLYAASREGKWIDDPLGHAISRLRAEPRQGAGPAFDPLAALRPRDLQSVIDRALEDPLGVGSEIEDRQGHVFRDAMTPNVRSLTKVRDILFGRGGSE